MLPPPSRETPAPMNRARGRHGSQDSPGSKQSCATHCSHELVVRVKQHRRDLTISWAENEASVPAPAPSKTSGSHAVEFGQPVQRDIVLDRNPEQIFPIFSSIVWIFPFPLFHCRFHPICPAAGSGLAGRQRPSPIEQNPRTVFSIPAKHVGSGIRTRIGPAHFPAT